MSIQDIKTKHYLEHLGLAGLRVCVLFSSLLAVMLALPLGPHFGRPTLELTTTLAALTRHICRTHTHTQRPVVSYIQKMTFKHTKRHSLIWISSCGKGPPKKLPLIQILFEW